MSLTANATIKTLKVSVRLNKIYNVPFNTETLLIENQTEDKIYTPDTAGTYYDKVDYKAYKPAMQEKTVEITENGTTYILSDENKTLSKVNVITDVQPRLQEKIVTPTTEAQVVTADADSDGLSKVTIEAVTASIDANITAENIKKGVDILGVTGTHEGGGDSIIRTVSGACPIILQDCAESTLLDYKIYGAEGGVGDKNKNLFNPYTLIKGYSGQWSDGSLVANANGSISDYIDIEGSSKITVTILTETNGGASHPLYFYDADKNYIQISDELGLLTDKPGQRSKTFTVPEGAKYCRFYILTNYSKGNTVWAQIEVGDTFTGYVPYGYEVHVKVNDDVYTIPSIYPQLGEGDYIDFENRKTVIGGASTLMELPELPLIEGNNTFDVDTTVKPTNVDLTYVKKVEFNTMKTVEGTLPLTVEGAGQRLEDYRIYGAEGGVGTVDSELPEEYMELEYIESTGTQYINTGLFVDTADALNGSEIVFAPTSLVVEGISYTENPVICGAVSTSGYVGYQAVINANTGKLGGVGCTYDKTNVAVNEKVTVTLTSVSTAPNRYFALFGKNQGASGQTNISVSSKSSGRLYSAKIMYKGELALNLIPAQRRLDGVNGLYDTVTNTFFTNAGTGSFLLSKFRVPIKVNDVAYDTYVDYPLDIGDYIDFENRSTVIGGVSTRIDLPEIYLQNGQNVIDVDTAVKPNKMSVSFVDNNGGYAAGYKEGYNEAYTKMKLAIDMTNVKYRFNEKVTSYPSNWYRININFTDSNGNMYRQLVPYTSSGKINIQYYPISGTPFVAFNAANDPMWRDESYRNIYIKDGDMVNDIETFRWLVNNGVFNPEE